jgi:hypothetical protein
MKTPSDRATIAMHGIGNVPDHLAGYLQRQAISTNRPEIGISIVVTTGNSRNVLVAFCASVIVVDMPILSDVNIEIVLILRRAIGCPRIACLEKITALDAPA